MASKLMKDLESVVIQHVINSDNPIDWNHWFQLAFWTPQEAIFLLHLTNPNKFNDVMAKYNAHKEAHPDVPYAETIEEIVKLINHAIREQSMKIIPKYPSPKYWIKWGRFHKIKIHSNFKNIGKFKAQPWSSFRSFGTLS